MPNEDKNIGDSLVLDLRIWWRHVKTDSYCEAVGNPIIISRQGTSQQQVEYRAK